MYPLNIMRDQLGQVRHPTRSRNELFLRTLRLFWLLCPYSSHNNHHLRTETGASCNRSNSWGLLSAHFAGYFLEGIRDDAVKRTIHQSAVITSLVISGHVASDSSVANPANQNSLHLAPSFLHRVYPNGTHCIQGPILGLVQWHNQDSLL